MTDTTITDQPRRAVVLYAPDVAYQFDIVWWADGTPHGTVVDGVAYACVRRKRTVLVPASRGGWIQSLIRTLR